MKSRRPISIKAKWILIACLVVVYPFILYLMYPFVGKAIASLVGVAPILATLMFGFRAGLVIILINCFSTYLVFNHFTGLTIGDELFNAFFPLTVTACICFGADRFRQRLIQQKEMEAELNQAKKMEALGRLAGGVAHDINNTLNAIMGSVFAHRQELRAASCNLFQDLDNIAAACDRGAQLTRSLLGFARSGKLKKQAFSLNAVVKSIQAVVGRTASKDVTLLTELTDGKPFVKGNRGETENAVMNLCLNAVDAIEDRGTVTIRTACFGAHVSISVSDTGSGMDEDVREHVFEPFFTTKPEDKGTGLGLSMVYGLVRAMNGRITLKSRVGVGTTVTLTFPKAPTPSSDSEPHAVTIDVDPEIGFLSGRTVLLIDDEPLVLRAGIRMLKALGCKVISANSGEEGIALFNAGSAEISLIILDAVMPRIDGAAVLNAISDAISDDTGVLLVSGYSRDSEEMDALQLRHERVAFLAKPYRSDQLVAAAKEVLLRGNATYGINENVG